MKNQFTNEAERLIKALGGKDNILGVSQYLTRLHFRLLDDSLVNDREIEALENVLRVFRRQDEYRVVLGGDVAGLYQALEDSGIERIRTFSDSGSLIGSTKSLVGRFFDYLSGSMAPLVPALLAGGLLRVLTALLGFTGLLSESSDTYAILTVIGNAFFSFLPLFLAATAADRLGASKPLALLVAAVLVHPELAALFSRGEVHFLGLPVREVAYASAVFPILLLIPMMKAIEDFAEKLLPPLVRFVFKPFLVVLISAPLALLIIGPLGALMGDLLAQGIERLYADAAWLAVALLAALIPFIAMTGMHHSLLPLATVSLTTLGYDPLIVIALFCSHLAQGGAALAVALVSREKRTRQIALGAGLSSIVAGSFESALYGINLRRRTPLLAACLAAGTAGLFAGYANLKATSLSGAPALFAPIQLLSHNGEDNLIAALITLCLSLFLSFTLTLLLYREKAPKEAEAQERRAAFFPSQTPFAEQAQPASASPAPICINSPLSGQVLSAEALAEKKLSGPLAQAFCAIQPADGHLYAPVNGKLIHLFDTHHALTLLSEEGVELLIHVGEDTVSLGGRHFTAYRQNGDELRAGDLILSFDLDALDKDGFDLVTPLVVTNRSRYGALTLLAEDTVTAGDPLFEIHEERAKSG